MRTNLIKVGFQYRRQQTAAAKGFPFSTRPAVSDCRKKRLLMIALKDLVLIHLH